MKNTMIALATAGLISFGASAQAGDAAAGQSSYGSCIGCHGAAGEGGIGPKLAGVDTASTVEKLKNIKPVKKWGQ